MGAVDIQHSEATAPLKSPVKEDVELKGRTLWLTQMPFGGSFMLAAAFRSIGLDARVVPSEDARVLELGGKYTSGDECYPQRIVLGRVGAVLNTGSVGRVTLISEVGEGTDLSTTRRLSLARARAVRAALVAGGLAETRIDIRAMGHTAAHRDTVDVLGPLVVKP